MNSSASLVSKLDYYLIDFWKVKDSRISELPLIGSGPWVLLTFMSIYLLIATHISRTMKNRDAYFIRPVQIIYYGCMFGIHGIAVPVILTLARSPVEIFRCNLNGLMAGDFRGTMFIYAGLLYLLIKLISCVDLWVLFWTKMHSKVTFSLLAETILGPFILYGQMKYYPGGITYFPVALDCAVNTIKYGLSTRSCASDDLKPIANWEQIVYYLKCAQYVVSSLHSLYSLNIQNCDCPLGLRYFQLALHLYLALVYIVTDNSKVLQKHQKSKTIRSISSPRKIPAKVL